MGTNYYHTEAPCPTCNRPSGPEHHIGKSSCGWCFALHVYPEHDINDLADWERLWEKPGSSIHDEYGRKITREEMRKIITERDGNGLLKMTADELAQNDATLYANNLLRRNLDSRCIGHGEGSWDLCVDGIWEQAGSGCW